MSKMPVQFDSGETYARLMDEIRSINNVAFLTKGKLEPHLQDRLEKSAEAAHRIMLDEVVVEPHEPHSFVNLDADPPKEER